MSLEVAHFRYKPRENRLGGNMSVEATHFRYKPRENICIIAVALKNRPGGNILIVASVLETSQKKLFVRTHRKRHVRPGRLSRNRARRKHRYNCSYFGNRPE
jgi:hypothetical protein